MNEKLQRLVTEMPFGVMVWHVDDGANPDVTLTFANEQSTLESSVDYTPLLNKPMKDIFPGWEDNTNYPEAIIRVARSGEPSTMREVPYGDVGHPHGYFNVSLVPLGEGYVGSIYENVTVKRRLEHRLRQMAMEDPLTGLVNLRGFKKNLREALGRAERSGKMAAVLFCDLDGFKAVNDMYGHETGDLALKAVAEKFVKGVRKIDTVGRLGGDEFGVIVEGIMREADVEVIAKKLIDEIATDQMYLGGRRRAKLGVSVGIALAVYADEDIDLLLQHGDAAMYKAKESGGNRYEFFNGHAELA